MESLCVCVRACVRACVCVCQIKSHPAPPVSRHCLDFTKVCWLKSQVLQAPYNGNFLHPSSSYTSVCMVIMWIVALLYINYLINFALVEYL